MTTFLNRTGEILHDLNRCGLSAAQYEARHKELAAFYTNLTFDLAEPKAPFVASCSNPPSLAPTEAQFQASLQGEGGYLPRG